MELYDREDVWELVVAIVGERELHLLIHRYPKKLNINIYQTQFLFKSISNNSPVLLPQLQQVQDQRHLVASAAEVLWDLYNILQTSKSRGKELEYILNILIN